MSAVGKRSNVMLRQKHRSSHAPTADVLTSNACSAASPRSAGRVKGEIYHKQPQSGITNRDLSYIKELADRINSIEGKLGASVVEALEAVARKSVTESLPSPQSATVRKRTFSSFAGDGYPKPPPPPPSIRGPWHTEPIKAPFTAWPGNKNPHEAVTPTVLPDGSLIPPYPAAGIPDAAPDGVASDALQPNEPGREIDDVTFDW